MNDFAVYIEKYFARGLYCKFEPNIFQCIPRNHSIIVLSHRLFIQGGREGGRGEIWRFRVLNFYDWAITRFKNDVIIFKMSTNSTYCNNN